MRISRLLPLGSGNCWLAVLLAGLLAAGGLTGSTAFGLYHGHPDTGEDAIVEIGRGHRGGRSANWVRTGPVFAVFPSGEVFWSVDYARGEGIKSGTELLATYGEERLREMGVEPGQLLSPEQERRIPREEDLKYPRYIAYYTGELRDDVREEILGQLGELDTQHVGGLTPWHGPVLTLRTISSENWRGVSGLPLFRIPDEAMPIHVPDEHLSRQENWDRLLPSLFSIIHHVDPDTVTKRFVDIRHDPAPSQKETDEPRKETTEPAAPSRPVITEVDAPQPVDAAEAVEFLENIRKKAEEDRPGALASLRAALDTIPESEKALAYLILARLELHEGNTAAAREAVRKALGMPPTEEDEP